MTLALLEDIRFGYGPLGSRGPEQGGFEPERLLAQLDGPDPAGRWKRPPLAERLALREARRAENLARRENRALPRPAREALDRMAAADRQAWVGRAATSERGFRERLVNLWCNRLTVASGRGDLPFLVQSFRDEAIRPHVRGRFADMLTASVFHPAMLIYLDQLRSVAPDSRIGRRRSLGLNENLARELLELHSMGGRGYDQDDVTELARLLAGLSLGPEGAVFDPLKADPGRKTILGQRYGEGAEEIRRLLEDLALRPETAASVARMLASHFLSDTPPADLVERMTRRYLRSGGELRATYAALLTHPAAADPVLRKIRSPHDYVTATLRALDLTGAETLPKGTRPLPEMLRGMGQPIYAPGQPNGWPDTGDDWLTPPMLATRIDWAVSLARRGAEKTDPLLLSARVLGDLGQPATHQAVRRAEQRWEGVAVLFASPDFMRR